MISAYLLLSVAALLLFVGVRLNAKARRLEVEKAALLDAWTDLAALVAPRIQTHYEARISEEEAERMQRIVGFGAVMDALSRRTSWRNAKKGEVRA